MSDCTGAPKGICDMLKRVTLQGKDSLSWLGNRQKGGMLAWLLENALVSLKEYGTP